MQSKGFPCVLFVPCNLTSHSKGIPFYPVICMSMEKGIPCNWEKPLIIRGDHFFYNRFPLCRVKDFPVFPLYPLLPCKYLQCNLFKCSTITIITNMRGFDWTQVKGFSLSYENRKWQKNFNFEIWNMKKIPVYKKELLI